VVSEAGGATPHQPSPKGTAQGKINPFIEEHHFLGQEQKSLSPAPGL